MRPDGGEGIQRLGRRMPEAIARAHADERAPRGPHSERRWHVAVGAPVVCDLEHVHTRTPRLENAALRALLGIPEKQRPPTAHLHEQHHARVVRIEQPLAADRPQHADVRIPDRPDRVAAQSDDIVGTGGTGARQLIHGRVIHVGNADPRRPADPRQTRQASRVVVVRVCQHETIETADPRTRKRPSK